jgi:hypothetical protein
MAEKKYKGVSVVDRAIKEGLISALEAVGADLTGKAQRITPVDQGTLKASGRWELADRAALRSARIGSRTAKASVNVIFETPYARRQHEETSYQHAKGQAKYLERPLKENALAYRKVIERSIKQELSRRL